MRDLTLTEATTGPHYSTDPTRADYGCPAYREMVGRWEIVEDVRAGTLRLRAKRDRYLPRFEAEDDIDYDARIGMTFVEDIYARTVVDHVGLVCSQPIKPSDDVPPALMELFEDIDGEGNHLDVFAFDAMDSAVHLGHSVIFTDYPVTDAVRNLTDQRAAKVRPYTTLYRACDVLSWRPEVVGGVVVLVQVMFREHVTVEDGDFGSKPAERYREFKQEVFRDPVTNRATGLGAITWRVFTRGEDGVPTLESEGTIKGGPARIPARVIYGGEKTGTLSSRPSLFGLALKSIEEAQVQSDYAAVMHKVNVPTPYFCGRPTPPPGQADTIKMGRGIDLPIDGSAGMLEPSGNAINATRTRLLDIHAAMQRQGASGDVGTGQKLTATEASIVAKQRNAKLKRMSRSAQDAFEGMLQDMAAYMGLSTGGSVTVNQEFYEERIDPAYMRVLVDAYVAGALELPDLIEALQTGKLPEDMDAMESALRLIAGSIAEADNEPEPEPAPTEPEGEPAEVEEAA